MTGDFGVLNGVFDVGCEWIITVEDGFRVEIEFEEIHVSRVSRSEKESALSAQ